MEDGSEGDKNKTPEGAAATESKSKRKMKTAAQLEVLENTYKGLSFLIFNFTSLLQCLIFTVMVCS